MACGSFCLKSMCRNGFLSLRNVFFSSSNLFYIHCYLALEYAGDLEGTDDHNLLHLSYFVNKKSYNVNAVGWLRFEAALSRSYYNTSGYRCQVAVMVRSASLNLSLSMGLARTHALNCYGYCRP